MVDLPIRLAPSIIKAELPAEVFFFSIQHFIVKFSLKSNLTHSLIAYRNYQISKSKIYRKHQMFTLHFSRNY